MLPSPQITAYSSPVQKGRLETHNEAMADAGNNILGLRAQILGKHFPPLYSHPSLLDVSNTTQTMSYSSALPSQ
jgi:hypothetical protein